MTNVDKARAAGAALETLRDEYQGRPDVQHAITEFLELAGPSTLARLFDIVSDEGRIVAG